MPDAAPWPGCQCDGCVGDLYTCDPFFGGGVPVEVHDYTPENIADDGLLLHWADADGGVTGVETDFQLALRAQRIMDHMGKTNMDEVCGEEGSAVQFGRVFCSEMSFEVIESQLRDYGYDRPVYVKGFQTSVMFLDEDTSHACMASCLTVIHEPFRSILCLVYRVMGLGNRRWHLARCVLAECNYAMFVAVRVYHWDFGSHWRKQFSIFLTEQEERERNAADGGGPNAANA